MAINQRNHFVGRVASENDIGGLAVQRFGRSNGSLDLVDHFLVAWPKAIARMIQGYYHVWL